MEPLNIEAYVPHRGSMRLIDRLIEVDEEHVVAETVVPLDGLFVRDGHVPAWVGIEYMAQTIAAWAGGRSLRSGGGPKIGFLLGSRRYVAHRPDFPCGAVLRIEARCELIADNGLGMFDCRIMLANTEIASAKVSVFEPEDGAAFLKKSSTP